MLLSLNFHVSEIREFEQHKSVDNTLSMFRKELDTIDRELQNLKEIRENIHTKMQFITHAQSLESDQVIRLKAFPERPCIMISETNIPDSRVSLSAMEYVHTRHQKINMIGACDCYTLDLENSNPSSLYYRTYNVFLYYPNCNIESNFSLPAGEYLTLSYVGSPVKTKQYMPSMYRYAKEQHLKVTGMPIEFDYIDAYETDNPDEYVIEIQLPVASSCQEEQPTG